MRNEEYESSESADPTTCRHGARKCKVQNNSGFKVCVYVMSEAIRGSYNRCCVCPLSLRGSSFTLEIQREKRGAASQRNRYINPDLVGAPDG